MEPEDDEVTYLLISYLSIDADGHAIKLHDTVH